MPIKKLVALARHFTQLFSPSSMGSNFMRRENTCGNRTGIDSWKRITFLLGLVALCTLNSCVFAQTIVSHEIVSFVMKYENVAGPMMPPDLNIECDHYKVAYAYTDALVADGKMRNRFPLVMQDVFDDPVPSVDGFVEGRDIVYDGDENQADTFLQSTLTVKMKTSVVQEDATWPMGSFASFRSIEGDVISADLARVKVRFSYEHTVVPGLIGEATLEMAAMSSGDIISNVVIAPKNSSGILSTEFEVDRTLADEDGFLTVGLLLNGEYVDCEVVYLDPE